MSRGRGLLSRARWAPAQACGSQAGLPGECGLRAGGRARPGGRERGKGPGAEGSREFPGAEQSVRPESTSSLLRIESVPRDRLRRRSLGPAARHRAGSRRGQSDYYRGGTVLRPHSAGSEPSAGQSAPVPAGCLGDQLAACLELRVFLGQ